MLQQRVTFAQIQGRFAFSMSLCLLAAARVYSKSVLCSIVGRKEEQNLEDPLAPSSRRLSTQSFRIQQKECPKRSKKSNRTKTFDFRCKLRNNEGQTKAKNGERKQEQCNVDEIGDSEMVFGEMRPRIRHRLPGIHLTVGENLGRNPNSSADERRNLDVNVSGSIPRYSFSFYCDSIFCKEGALAIPLKSVLERTAKAIEKREKSIPSDDRGFQAALMLFRRRVVYEDRRYDTAKPQKNLNHVTRPDRVSNPGYLVSQPDALTITPQHSKHIPRIWKRWNWCIFRRGRQLMQRSMRHRRRECNRVMLERECRLNELKSKSNSPQNETSRQKIYAILQRLSARFDSDSVSICNVMYHSFSQLGASERTDGFQTIDTQRGEIYSEGDHDCWVSQRMQFQLRTWCWSGVQRAFIVETFLKNEESVIATQDSFRHRMSR
ncbi:hypothetical protein ANN_22619 [Periplaneta americana]|uniref:Uncharacterized protein n=1 Tax=Periplaneta americana TaxID=6978 RepID=A0ABQ8S8Z7_PERAM|nr:hypothetical protein ANN_22619 [Periplaneta americana]